MYKIQNLVIKQLYIEESKYYTADIDFRCNKYDEMRFKGDSKSVRASP